MIQRFAPVVLGYHAVSASWGHVLSVPPALLARQLRALLASGLRPATLAQTVEGRGRLLHVTFDDAFVSVLNALHTLERLGVPSTVFACSGLAGPPAKILEVPELVDEATMHPEELRTLGWEQLSHLASRGVEIGSHTVSHPHLRTLSDTELALELRDSRTRIEDMLSRPCRFLAYPYGEYDARVADAARAAGYEAAFTLPGRISSVGPFSLPRMGMFPRDTAARTFIRSLPFVRRVRARDLELIPQEREQCDDAEHARHLVPLPR